MRTIDDLDRSWAARPAPSRDAGTVRLLCVRPPGSPPYHTPEAVELTAHNGVAGDRWALREPSKDPDGVTAVTLIDAGLARLVADAAPAELVGDNVHVDLDIAVANLPPGSRLRIGDAILRVSEQPHTGCSTFRDRFGLDALKWVSTPEGRAERRRGMNCSVETPGTVRLGDAVEVIERPAVVAEAVAS